MKYRHHKAFTFIELLFVIIVLGVIGGVAIEAIRQYYEGIFKTNSYTKKVTEADHILELLSGYFENAIDASIVNLDQDAADGTSNGTCFGDLQDEAEITAHDYTVAFVGVDSDSLHVVGNPGWSEMAQGFSGTLGTSMTSSDANFTAANGIIAALRPGTGIINSAVYNDEVIGDAIGSCGYFNWDNLGGNQAYYSIIGVNYMTNTLTLTNHSTVSPQRNDRKYLLRTGYAFRVMDTGRLVIYNNFRPWRGENYNSGTTSTLGEGVASFYAAFDARNSHSDRGGLWKLKVCMQGLDSNLSNSDEAVKEICRERMVHVRY